VSGTVITVLWVMGNIPFDRSIILASLATFEVTSSTCPDAVEQADAAPCSVIYRSVPFFTVVRVY
jgi:hypothetical protein